MEELNSKQKGSRWLSLLSVLMAARVAESKVVLVERAESGEWDFAFWNLDPEGIICTYRCGPGKSIWIPIESPVYSGRIRPWENPDSPRNKDLRKK